MRHAAAAHLPGEPTSICWELATHQVLLDSARDDCHAALAKE
jgi:hypothetical protein